MSGTEAKFPLRQVYIAGRRRHALEVMRTLFSTMKRPAVCRCTVAAARTVPGSAAVCTRTATLGASPNTSPLVFTPTGPESIPMRAASSGTRLGHLSVDSGVGNMGKARAISARSRAEGHKTWGRWRGVPRARSSGRKALCSRRSFPVLQPFPGLPWARGSTAYGCGVRLEARRGPVYAHRRTLRWPGHVAAEVG